MTPRFREAPHRGGSIGFSGRAPSSGRALRASVRSRDKRSGFPFVVMFLRTMGPDVKLNQSLIHARAHHKSAALTRVGAAAALAVAGVAVSASAAESATSPSYAYVAAGEVDAIDLATGTVAATIFNQADEVILNQVGTEAFSANQTDTVSVIDTGTNTVTATLSVGGTPTALAISPDGSTVYVSYFTSTAGGIEEIDTATDTVAANIALGFFPYTIALSPSGTTLYAGDGTHFAVDALDLASGSVVASVPTGGDNAPESLAVSPDGSTVYSENYDVSGGSSTVTVIDAGTDTVTDSIAGIGDFGQIAVDPGGGLVYVAQSVADSVTVLDAATDTVADVITGVGPLPTSVAFAGDGSVAYVGSGAGLFEIDTLTDTIVGTAQADSGVGSIALPQTATPTSTTITASPSGTADQGSAVTLTATETPATAGTIQFYDGETALGSPVAVDDTGTASYSTAGLALGSHSFAAAFIPSSTAVSASASPAAALQIVQPPLTIDQTVIRNGSGIVTTAPFSTAGPRLLIAFTSSDGPSSSQSTTVTGAGLTWTLIQRSDTRGGTAETIARTVASGQTLDSQWVDTKHADTFWVQNPGGPTAQAGTSVTISDTAPTKDMWNMAAVEILPTA